MNTSKFLGLIVIAFFIFSSLSAQEITMFSGFWKAEYYEDDNQISKKQLEDKFQKYDEIYNHWKKGKTFSTLSWASLGVSYGFLIWELAEFGNTRDIDDYKPSIGRTIGFFGSAAVSGVFMYLSLKFKKKAILDYNKTFDGNSSSLIIRPSDRGIGLMVEF